MRWTLRGHTPHFLAGGVGGDRSLTDWFFGLCIRRFSRCEAHDRRRSGPFFASSTPH